ncbi:hypothetical protein RRG08_016197 [Elysia crispata]|uniref:Uncharacterized protein n=1 Tax=Elysia crispata TaxID=231223 RepID=A0AAE0ZP82_9GAST|nr:hypothetical protein RRG08_016197 [Elysia crispata]
MEERVSLQLAKGPSNHRHGQGRRPRSGVGSTRSTTTPGKQLQLRAGAGHNNFAEDSLLVERKRVISNTDGVARFQDSPYFQ